MRRVAPCGNCRVLSREHGPAVRVRPPERRGPYVIAVAVHSLGVVSVHRYSSMRRTFPFAVCLVVARVLEALAGQAVPAPGQPTFENRLFANAAIAMTSGLTPSQHFTSDRQPLLAAAERFRGRYVPRSRRVWGSVEGSFGRSPVAQDPGPDAMDRERQIKAWNARRMLRSVERFAEWMGGLDARRKAIVLIGQGIDYDTRDLFGDRDALVLLEETSHVAGATARHNVTLYAIDPRGLPTGRRSSIRTRVLVDESPDATWRGKQSLRALAEETGGAAFINSNQFGQAFERVVREQSTYYLPGYRAPRDVPDGRLHHIRIRVNRPDVTVQARRSYVHTRVPDELNDIPTLAAALLDSPLPQPGLRLELTGLSLRGDHATAQSVVVAVRLEPPGDGGRPLPVDTALTVVAADADGTVLARRTVDVPVPAELRRVVQERGLRVLFRLDLPKPGPIHLRAAVVERLTGASGSVHLRVGRSRLQVGFSRHEWSGHEPGPACASTDRDCRTRSTEHVAVSPDASPDFQRVRYVGGVCGDLCQRIAGEAAARHILHDQQRRRRDRVPGARGASDRGQRGELPGQRTARQSSPGIVRPLGGGAGGRERLADRSPSPLSGCPHCRPPGVAFDRRGASNKLFWTPFPATAHGRANDVRGSDFRTGRDRNRKATNFGLTRLNAGEEP